MLTHLTTNLSASEIGQAYGNHATGAAPRGPRHGGHVRSRMREMFNLIAFDKTAQDKRV